eukprot:Nitzschia sp. Nitz4//scaffold37_size175936//10905//11743//NITZ4_002023-RA/size175936-processed-gene-0.169-mRNA-1//1//CDS//3329549719//7660//frame0
MLDVDLPDEWTSSNESVDAAAMMDDLWRNETGTPSVTDDISSNQAMSTVTTALVWGSVLTFLCVWCCCSIVREYQQQAERLRRELASSPSNKKGGTPKDWNEHFAKSGCQMTVSAKEHIVATETDIEQPPDPGGPPELPTEDMGIDDDEGVGYLMIPPKQATNGSIPRVPNCCVICMDSYKDGEEVVWSKDPDCRHVFHRDCFVEYLVCHKGKDRPCPTCRRDFCDRLDQPPVKSEKTIPVAGVTER